MGHPNYDVTDGSIELIKEDGTVLDILAIEPTDRARAGVFMAFQRPMAIPGVKMADFLRHAASNVPSNATTRIALNARLTSSGSGLSEGPPTQPSQPSSTRPIAAWMPTRCA